MKLSRSQIVALTCFLAGAMFAPSTVLAMDADTVDDDTPMTDAGEAYADELDDFDEFDEYALPEISDPFESFNRTMFKFNASAMKFVFRPITQGYEAVVPSPARRGLVSFFENIRYPVRLVSNVLQGNPKRAYQETEKFLINTTIGVGGFFKVSDRYPDLRVPNEDIGQAFGKWGLPAGPYVVVPILGPYTVRDGFGGVGDFYLTPLNWGFVDRFDAEPRLGLFVLDKVATFPEVLALWDTATRSAVDPYVSVRNGYIQYREEEVKK